MTTLMSNEQFITPAEKYRLNMAAPKTALDYQSALKDPLSKIRQEYNAMLNEILLEEEEIIHLEEHCLDDKRIEEKIRDTNEQEEEIKFEKKHEQLATQSKPQKEDAAIKDESPDSINLIQELVEALFKANLLTHEMHANYKQMIKQGKQADLLKQLADLLNNDKRPDQPVGMMFRFFTPKPPMPGYSRRRRDPEEDEYSFSMLSP